MSSNKVPDDSDPLVVANFFFFGSIFPGANRKDPQSSPPSENAGGRRPPPAGEWKGWPWDFSSFPHEDFGPQVNYAIWMLTALSAVFLALRVYCKFLRHKGLWWDDHVLIVSWISLVAQTALISFNVSIGYGQHIWDFHPKDLQTFLLMSNSSGFFSILAAMLSKTSFAITVLRISEGWTRRFVWFIIITINAFLSFAALSTYVQCTPSEKLWRPMLQGTCWPKEFIIDYNIFTAGYSGAMDIILALLPWRIIWKLTINKREKLGVMVAMSMGIFAGAISFAKIEQLPAINKSDLIHGLWLSILGTAEAAMTIVAASIPVLRALVHHNSPQRHPAPARFVNNTDMLYAGGTNLGRNSTTVTSWSGKVPPPPRGRLNNYQPQYQQQQPPHQPHQQDYNHPSRHHHFRRDSSSSTRSWAQRLHVSRKRESPDEEWFYRLEAGRAPPMGKIEVAEEVSVQFEDSGIRPVARVDRPVRAGNRGGGYDPRGQQQPDLERQATQYWGPLRQQNPDAGGILR
ncbi:uncharacterized protein PpBr36_09870 [Pyricularia pennisetigena]|uniref:uncharacterized protein n=1 Tax=Pyricularia pennisetigena TaxID=1578925 RepID=UPI001154983C|nr:uncharacterized protein PpBr36_09870 [Pyricularia pennisetigena]TLS22299.1 hypothetical protein PpBr36_09870 [Pyricularia pennisetigena]